MGFARFFSDLRWLDVAAPGVLPTPEVVAHLLQQQYFVGTEGADV
jgi:hypothetical protein